MDNEKSKFNDAMVMLRTAFNLLGDAKEILVSIGVKVCNIQYNNFSSGLYPTYDHVSLMSGINKVSELTETRVDGNYHPEYGNVVVDGVSFLQSKMPVERIDRYA